MPIKKTYQIYSKRFLKEIAEEDTQTPTLKDIITNPDIQKDKTFYGLFAYGLNLLAGKFGVGKTYLLIRLALEFTQTTKRQALLVFFDEGYTERFKNKVDLAIKDYCATHNASEQDLDLSLIKVKFEYPGNYVSPVDEAVKANLDQLEKDLFFNDFVGIDPLLKFADVGEFNGWVLRDVLVGANEIQSAYNYKKQSKILIFTHHYFKYNSEDIENYNEQILIDLSKKERLKISDLFRLTYLEDYEEISNIVSNAVFALPAKSEKQLRLIVYKSNLIPLGTEKNINYELAKPISPIQVLK